MSNINYEPSGFQFYDLASAREMKWVFGDRQENLNDWLVYKHPDGQWVTLRKITEADKKAMIAAAPIAIALPGTPVNPNRDWSYSEGCGCVVTFIGASDFKASRMTPGATCARHTGRNQESERDSLIGRAGLAFGDWKNWSKRVEPPSKAHGGIGDD
jgi:hypothetical protein